MRYTDPFDEVLNEIIDYWSAEGETFERICKAIFDISEYTSHIEIAETAGCSRNSVKKHLDRLAELGLVDKHPGTELACYRRNSAYIEWRVLQHIIDKYPVEEIIERVAELETRQEEMSKRVEELEAPHEGTSDETGDIPSIRPTPNVKLNKSVSTWLEAANELETIKLRIRLYKLAYETQKNDGHLISREF